MEDICLLPDDLVEDILSRLPAKILGKASLVSKKWKSIISSDHFKHIHNQKSLKNPNLILLSESFTSTGTEQSVLITVDLDGEVADRWDLSSAGVHYPSMLRTSSGSSNLVCLVAELKRFVVCNPRTRQAISIPEPESDEPYPFSDSDIATGFGYLPSRDRYAIVHGRGRDEWRMATFSVKELLAGSGVYWNLIGDEAPLDMPVMPFGVCASEVMYWTGSAYAREEDARKLMCFDLCEEKFSVVAMPGEVGMDNWHYGLVELGGYLNVMYWMMGNEMLEMWTLEYGDDGSSYNWVRWYIEVEVESLYRCFIPLMVDEEGEILAYNGGGFVERYRLQESGIYRSIGQKGHHEKIPDYENISSLNLHTDLL